MIPDKIKKVLGSKDIELVRLGAAWIMHNLPQEDWLDQIGRYIQPSFIHTIEEDTVYIDYIKIEGLWSQLASKRQKHTYKMEEFTVDKLTEVIQDYFKNKNNE